MSISSNINGVIKTSIPMYTPFKMMSINEILPAYGEKQFTFDFTVKQAIVIGPTSVAPRATIFHYTYGYTSFYDLSSGNSATNDGSTTGVGGGSHTDDQVSDTGHTDSDGNTTADDDNSGATPVSYAVSTKSYLEYTIDPDKIIFRNLRNDNKNQQLGFLLILIGYDQYCNNKIVTNNNNIIRVDDALPIKYVYANNSGAYIPAYINKSRIRLAIIDTKLLSQNSGITESDISESTNNLKNGSYYDLNVDIDVRTFLSFGCNSAAFHLRPYVSSSVQYGCNVANVENTRSRDNIWDDDPTKTCYKSTELVATGRNKIVTAVMRPREDNNNTIRFINLDTSSQQIRSILVMFGI